MTDISLQALVNKIEKDKEESKIIPKYIDLEIREPFISSCNITKIKYSPEKDKLTVKDIIRISENSYVIDVYSVDGKKITRMSSDEYVTTNKVILETKNNTKDHIKILDITNKKNYLHIDNNIKKLGDILSNYYSATELEEYEIIIDDRIVPTDIMPLIGLTAPAIIHMCKKDMLKFTSEKIMNPIISTEDIPEPFQQILHDDTWDIKDHYIEGNEHYLTITDRIIFTDIEVEMVVKYKDKKTYIILPPEYNQIYSSPIETNNIIKDLHMYRNAYAKHKQFNHPLIAGIAESDKDWELYSIFQTVINIANNMNYEIYVVYGSDGYLHCVMQSKEIRQIPTGSYPYLLGITKNEIIIQENNIIIDKAPLDNEKIEKLLQKLNKYTWMLDLEKISTYSNIRTAIE